MFARKKPARPAEISTPTDAPGEVATLPPEPGAPAETSTPASTDALGEVATPPPEPAAPAETSTLTPAPADALNEAATPPREPAPAHGARPVAPAARPKAVSFLAGDLALVGTLSGEGDVHLGGPFEGEIRVRDVTVGAGGRVEGVITGRRIEVLGRVRGGLVAGEVRVRTNAQVDGDVTSESFALDAGSRFEGRSKRNPR